MSEKVYRPTGRLLKAQQDAIRQIAAYKRAAKMRAFERLRLDDTLDPDVKQLRINLALQERCLERSRF